MCSGYGDLERVLVRGNLLGLILKWLPLETKLRTRTALGHFFLLVYIGQIIFCFEAFLCVCVWLLHHVMGLERSFQM